MSWEANSNQESPGLVPHLLSLGRHQEEQDCRSRARQRARLHTGDASEATRVGLAFILAPLFLSKLLELTRARRVTDCQRVVLHIVEC